ncbi:nuclear transport factor 2 family protein [Dactylosporangium sp. CS-033363]|uniref:nuclear transport factor 2 family protein n=1 Tax=Dactylosporangium sp. CS-033363 TaxID=3239935 RepID=UPI003D8A9398
MSSLLEEVTTLQARYCRGVDDRDPDLLRSLVADDVEIVGADGVRNFGVDGFMGVFDRYWARNPGPVLHLVSNVELLGDEVRSLFHAVSRQPDGSIQQTWGRYRDAVVRAGHGGLVFAAKRIDVVLRVRLPVDQ